jgi:hypothetical protein
MRHSTSKEDKAKIAVLTESKAVHDERWVVKKRPKNLETWG